MDEDLKREKQRLREEVQALVQGMPDAYLKRSDQGIKNALLLLKAWKRAQTIFIYVSLSREPDTRGLIQEALDAGKTVAVPRCLDGGKMEARVITSLDNLHLKRFGIPEPDADHKLLLPEELNLVVAPCVAADRQGYRLGHGGGYYDRYLREIQCPTVCLCRECLLRDNLPHDGWDQPVDIIVTDKQCIHRDALQKNE